MKKLSILTIIVLCTNIINAQWQQIDNVWTPTGGPFGGTINCIVSKDSVLFVGTNSNGIFISTDNGVSWSQANNGLTNHCIISLALKDSFIFAGTSRGCGGGIFRSSDNGSSWVQTSFNNYLNPNVIAEFGNKILVGTGYPMYDGYLYSSEDYGDNWTAVNNGIPSDNAIWSIQAKGSYLFVGTYHNGVYLSTDSGNTFINVNQNLGSFLEIFDLAVKDNNIFAATGDGVYQSSNNGNNWNFLSNGWPFSFVRTIAIKGDYIYAGTGASGVYKYDLNGNIWTEINNGLTNLIIYSLVVHDTLIFAGTNNGLFVTSNNGASWTSANNGLANVNVITMIAKDSVLLAGTSQNAIFVSNNNGDNWTASYNGLSPNFNNTTVNSFLINGSYVIAGTESGAFLSNDNGINWTGINNGLPTYAGILSLAIKDSIIFTGTNHGLYTSINNGNNWNQVINLPSSNTYCVRVIGNDCYTSNFGELRSSSDSGLNWLLINNGLPTNSWANSIIESGTYLFTGFSFGGIFRSSDYGTNWVQMNNGIQYYSVNSLVKDNINLFAGTTYNGVCMSTDSAASWVQINDSLTVSKINCLLIHNNYIFAGTPLGIYKRPLSSITQSGDTLISNSTIGNQWYDSNNTLIVGANSNKYIPTQNGSFYNVVTINGYSSPKSNTISYTLNIKNSKENKNFSFIFNSTENKIIIEFSEAVKNKMVSIYNITGQEMIRFKPVDYMTILGIKNLKSGVYFVKINDGKKIYTEKIVLL